MNSFFHEKNLVNFQKMKKTTPPTFFSIEIHNNYSLEISKVTEKAERKSGEKGLLLCFLLRRAVKISDLNFPRFFKKGREIKTKTNLVETCVKCNFEFSF